MNSRTQSDYFAESKRIRNEVLQLAELLKERPMYFIITNEITMRVQITKTDLKTIVSKNTKDNKFNAIKNALAKDIPGYLAKATYLGWRPVAEVSAENWDAGQSCVCGKWPMAISISLMPSSTNIHSKLV